MRTIIVIGLVALLAGCSGAPKKTFHETIQYKVVSVPESLYRCPDIPLPPPVPDTAEKQILERYDRQVAEYVVQLYESGKVCKESLEDIRKWIEQAEAEVEKTNAEARQEAEKGGSWWNPFD